MWSWLFRAARGLFGIGREPVAEDLVFRIGPSANDNRHQRVHFVVFLQIGNRAFDRTGGHVSDECTHLSLKTRALLEKIVDLDAGEPDRSPPSVSRIDGWRVLQLDEMLDNATKLALQR